MPSRAKMPRHPMDFPGSQAAIWFDELVEVTSPVYSGSYGSRCVRAVFVNRFRYETDVAAAHLDGIGPVARALLAVTT
jgi:hypothetical protein